MNGETPKSERAQKEEETLAFWKKHKIFEKSLQKESPKGEFIFYEGPPTANGLPGIHHLEARAFKDAIPRYKTMRGYHVRRKGGWDTHGLPVELQVEKELGLKTKKEIEEYGVEKFNEKCRESVWKYLEEWERFTDRAAYWVDLDNPYVTYHNDYIESVWNVVKQVHDNGRVYKDYRVVPWCPRCGTALSSHELAQGYEEVKDLSVYAKFKVKGKDSTYLLAWTTTPWTLPGNVALAVGEEIDYVKVTIKGERYILAKERLSVVEDEYDVVEEMKGRDLVGLSYEPVYDFISGEKDIENLDNAWKVYSADFVTTEDGTGIVHTAVMYGQDDFLLGNKVGLPKHHVVTEDGHFIDTLDFLSGKFVKDEETAVSIIKDLAYRNLLFKKEKHEHTYPHCWRCKTPLIYYARDSWYIRMTDLRNRLVEENNDINWEPEHIQQGRFGEWLREVKDWSLSRERYWGTPLPVWVSEDGKEQKALGSLAELKKETKRNTYFVVRHGEAESNAKNIVSGKKENPHHLTEKGKEEVKKAIKKLKRKGINQIIASPFIRTKETAELIADGLGIKKDAIIFDERIKEIDTGDFNLKSVDEYRAFFSSVAEKFTKRPPNGETAHDVKQRAGDFLYDIDKKYEGKTILIVTHEYLVWMLESVQKGLTDKESAEIKSIEDDYIHTGEVRALDFSYIPHNKQYELDFHRPFIDEVVLKDSQGNIMKRTPEVMDVWLDSGCMPYAQDHFPFENTDTLQPKKGWLRKQRGYPADFISEAIDQTRGWFYTLHALGVLLGYGKAYKNVISLGHILDENGKKMSKSLGNIVDPWQMTNTYGMDALRFWMYSVNQPGDSKNFDERSVDEISKKVFNLLINTTRFYKLYENKDTKRNATSEHILDKWILSRLSKLTVVATENLEQYNLLVPTREIREFIGDLSQWYVRRSRDRFKDEKTRTEALGTLRFVLFGLSRLMAPFTPFIAEEVYQAVKEEDDPESVHVATWPAHTDCNEEVLKAMEVTRDIVSDGLQKRAEAKIKVRQPLASVTIQNELDKEYQDLVREELNVKKVLTDQKQDTVSKLDITLTDELKAEGHAREFIRNVQDLRKKEKYSPDEKVTVSVWGDKRLNSIIKNYETTIQETANLKDILFEKNNGQELVDGDLRYTLALKK